MPDQKQRTRAQYTPEMKRLVREKYPLCRTYDDKLELARELGMESIHKLYNLASRLRVTRTFDEEMEGSPALDPRRRRVRPEGEPRAFDREDDRFLKKHFGKMLVEEIAFQRGMTESAVLVRARELNLRKPALYWQADRVADWLGCTPEGLRALHTEGLDFFDLPGRSGDTRLTVVSTTSLVRWLMVDDRAAALVESGRADKLFVDELLGSIRSMQGGNTAEACRFLSPGHVCMNPLAGIRYGLFCPKTERHPAGGDPKCNLRERRMDELHDMARAARFNGSRLPIFDMI